MFVSFSEMELVFLQMSIKILWELESAFCSLFAVKLKSLKEFFKVSSQNVCLHFR